MQSDCKKETVCHCGYHFQRIVIKSQNNPDFSVLVYLFVHVIIFLYLLAAMNVKIKIAQFLISDNFIVPQPNG